MTDISHIAANTALVGFSAVWVAFFCLAKLYSGDKSCKKIFTPLNTGIIIAFFISWTVMTGMALREETAYQKKIIHAGQFFGFPLSSEGLRSLYYKDASPDADFWKKFQFLLLKFKEETALRKQVRFMNVSRGNIEKKELELWKNTFETSARIKELEKLFPHTLLPPERDYLKYHLRFVSLDEMFLLLDFSRLQVWRIKFAIQNNDIKTALEALKRINASIDLLEKDHIPITHKHTQDLLCEKKNAIELLLESGNFPQRELEHQLNILAEKRRILAKTEPIALAGEMTDELDFREGFWQGGTRITSTPFPAVKNFRWFVPQCWYIFRRSSNILLDAWEKNSFKKIPSHIPEAQYFFAEKCAYWSKIPQWYTELNTWYLLLETLLKLELEKRRTGIYPDTAPEWLPIDPFTGKKLHYRKGNFPVWGSGYDSRTGHFKSIRRTVKAVAIWSEGRNGVNDWNRKDHKKNKSDDICVMIRL